MQTIYERIEYLIKQKGLTKKSFCEQLNISTGNMGDWKRGKTTPGTHKLIEIGDFFMLVWTGSFSAKIHRILYERAA